MNLSGILIGFVGVAILAAMIIFIGASQSVQVVDSFGNTSNAQGNLTNGLVANVTPVAGTSVGYLVLVIAALGICVGVGILYAYSRR